LAGSKLQLVRCKCAPLLQPTALGLKRSCPHSPSPLLLLSSSSPPPLLLLSLLSSSSSSMKYVFEWIPPWSRRGGYSSRSQGGGIAVKTRCLTTVLPHTQLVAFAWVAWPLGEL
jgi:hypothetical protein